LEACRAPLLELARTSGVQPPILVNLELSTRALLREFPGLDVEQLLEYPSLAFLDTPHACAPPPELDALAAQARGLWGRRADGSYGALDAAALVARPRVEPWKLYARIALAASYDDARARLASGALDPRAVALIEAPLGTLEEGGTDDLGADERVAPAAPLAIDREKASASIELDVQCAHERWLVAQHPLLYWELLRFSPEYERLGRVADPRAVRLHAVIDGAPVAQTLRAQGCGFALRVPAGAHRVQLEFSIQPVELSVR
jgi:hypothetical protein